MAPQESAGTGIPVRFGGDVNPMIPRKYQDRLVLASNSPRRIDILKGLGFEFEVRPAGEGVERGVTHPDPFQLAEVLAREKCNTVAQEFPDSLVIAADTVVILDGEVLNKPADDEQAVRYIARLAGRTHTVVTGLALQNRSDGVDLAGSERTEVTFRELSRGEIEAYAKTGEGRDKAGAYAAQGLGSFLIRRIEGCFYNVVGLPVALLFDMLKKIEEGKA